MSNPEGVPRPRSVSRWPPSEFAAAAAAHIAQAVQDTIRLRGRCTLALTGGSTPRPIYERMAASPLAERVDWSRVAIYFGDERCVPPDHEASNFRMAYEALLRHVPIPDSSVHRMEGERGDLDAAAGDYERILPESLDILLLGMGADGHTASLFPHTPALAERNRRVVALNHRPAPPARITITPPVIGAAHAVMVLVAGAGKAATLARALTEPYAPDELPIQFALHGEWFVDQDAARQLGDSNERHKA